MQLLISDSNILIDLIVVGHIGTMFQLPYTFAVPDILYEEELKIHHNELLSYGLEIRSLSSEAMAYAFELSAKYTQPGTNDLFALALAKECSCPLLTGDGALRQAAESEAVVLFGTIWIVEHMIRHRLITIEEGRELFVSMREKKRRLPWEVAKAHLNQLEIELGNET
ncbi:PIN domain-containing protein [Sulfuricurvum sp.]|uniref:PIN domain-containing protein n=1 Tax=Sulfuricurvum sp. TaxID=2025608 RepID=UPI003BB20E4B